MGYAVFSCFFAIIEPPFSSLPKGGIRSSILERDERSRSGGSRLAFDGGEHVPAEVERQAPVAGGKL